ncbi:MAG: AraC family transcriptional regulator [Blautia sp.]|nr:AraC family transcriptional regulator [Blautia sp.]
MITFFQTESQGFAPVPLLLAYLAEDYLQEPVNRPYGNPHYSCFLSLEGEGELTVSGETMKIREGECFILLPEVPCSYHGLSRKWIVSSAGFTGGISSSLFECLGLRESGVYTISDPCIFIRYIAKLRELTQNSQLQKDWSDCCYRFLLDLSHAITFHPGNGLPEQKELPEDSYAFRVITYLESHLAEPVSVPDLADLLGLNSEYLCTVFKKETGLTIIQYLQRLRIGRARMMLERFPERDAAEIGRACGYESPSYFCLQFKRITGTTPNQYRKTAASVRVP